MKFSSLLTRILRKIFIKYQESKLHYNNDCKVAIYGAFDIVNPEGFRFGSGLSINPYVYINATSNITLGENVSLSAHSALISTGLIYENGQLLTAHYSKDIAIGSNVHIGAGAIVLPGVTICDNVIVGAGAIVTKSIHDSGVYAGMPCKKLKKL
ncbi:TPA: acyltransferase [Vibrio vulnificus]|nr:acyltransferase [Vibrio vulnificus]